MSDRELLPVVRALAPYLDQLVIIGAWCHRLLRFHPLASPPAIPPLTTEDADIATPERLPARSPNLDEALTTGGFRARFRGDGNPPITRYEPIDDERGLYVELVTPLRGAEYTRRGEPDDVHAVSGATAQKLRYVELLLFEPWTHPFDDLAVRVANPASYLVQKLLTLGRRATTSKRAKDVLYVHDTLALFGAARIAAATGRANPPSPATIAAACTYGLEQIFA